MGVQRIARIDGRSKSSEANRVGLPRNGCALSVRREMARSQVVIRRGRLFQHEHGGIHYFMSTLWARRHASESITSRMTRATRNHVAADAKGGAVGPTRIRSVDYATDSLRGESMKQTRIAIAFVVLLAACTSMSTPPPPSELPTFAFVALRGAPVQLIILDQRAGERDARWAQRVQSDLAKTLTAAGTTLSPDAATRVEVRILRARSDFENRQWKG
jgi:hypothetical protein